jgi:hypothetical protein
MARLFRSCLFAAMLAAAGPLAAQQLPPPLSPSLPPPPQTEDEAAPERRPPQPNLARFDYEAPESIEDIWMIDDPVTGFGNRSLWQDSFPLRPREETHGRESDIAVSADPD